MADLIYRQAASYALNTIKVSKNETWYSLYQKVLDVFSNLPSAEPKLDEWCTDCKEYDQERHCCPRWNRVIRETLKDVKRKKGRWQITDAYPHNVYCPECHAKFAQTNWAVWEDGSLPRNFCPNCGVPLEGGEEDE